MGDGRDTQQATRLRTAFFIDDLGAGGTQRWLALLLKGLRERDYEHRVFVMRNIVEPVFLARVGESAEVDVVGEPALWGLHGLFRIRRALRRWRPHVVQTLLPTSDMIGRLLGRLARVPVVVSSIRGRHVDKPAWQRFLDRRTAGLADKVIFNAEEAIPFAVQHEGVMRDRAVYIPNGVAPTVPSRTAAEVKKGLGIPGAACVIGMVSRLHPSKGHRDLIQAFTLLAAEMKDVVLLIVGNGELRRNLESQVDACGLNGRVRFTGHRNDVPDLLGAMDVFAHPSQWEGMPNAVMEAMAAGRPVVASRVDGIKALITDGETGLLVAPGDPGMLAAQLRRVLSDPSLARILGAGAARRMAEHYGLDRMVAAYDALYRELLSRTTRVDGATYEFRR